jgi:hypothetical protein
LAAELGAVDGRGVGRDGFPVEVRRENVGAVRNPVDVVCGAMSTLPTT